MNQDALISFVLDKSSSMLSVVKPTVDGFNAFIADQRTAPGKAFLSLTLFDTTFDVRYVGADLDTVPPLGSPDNLYLPSGMTALFDAVGTTIKGTEKWLANRNFEGKVVVVILTDGQENSSREWHVNNPIVDGDDRDLGGLIKWKQEEGWEFVFLGSGGSSWLERTFGHVADAHSFAGFAHDGAATASAYAGVSSNLRSSRSTGTRFVAPKSS